MKTRKYSLSVQFFFNVTENLKPPMNEIGAMPEKDVVYRHTFEKSFLFPEVQQLLCTIIIHFSYNVLLSHNTIGIL